jgi:uncharacterized membrane protein YqjE
MEIPMKNWPFPTQGNQRPWWLTPLGLFATTAAIILVPIILLLLALTGLFVWAMWDSGGVGMFIAAFVVVGLVFILAAIWAALRS